MRRPRRGIGKKSHGSKDVTLQITSMADIFTVILVFLLKSYSGGDISISPTKGLKLPLAGTSNPPKAAVTVEIAENGIQVENKFVVALKQFKFASKDLLASGIPRDLNSQLERARKRQDLIAQANSDVKKDTKVLIVADQRTPYITLKRVISTAAVHGFNEPKLVVMVRD